VTRWVAGVTCNAEDERELLVRIERTREDLGETVGKLAAKADVKAQVRAKAAELIARVKAWAAQVLAPFPRPATPDSGHQTAPTFRGSRDNRTCQVSSRPGSWKLRNSHRARPEGTFHIAALISAHISRWMEA
jgi:hypothetical protein